MFDSFKPFSVRSHTNKKLVQSIKIHTTSLKPNERKKLTLFVSLSFFLCLDLRLSHFHYPTLVCLAVFLNAPFLCSLSVVWLIKVSFITRSLFVCLSVCLCSTVKNTTATLPVRPAELWSNQLGRFLHDSPVESNAQW